MTNLITRLESAAPSRKMAFLAAFGMFSIFMLLSALSGRFGASERLAHIIMDIGFAAAVVTWIEARRFKYIASELRSQQEALAAAALKARGFAKTGPMRSRLAAFILPAPDPLVEALNDMKDGRAGPTTESYASCLRTAMQARGYEWRKIGEAGE